jgi:tryptophan-rich sensory protein
MEYSIFRAELNTLDLTQNCYIVSTKQTHMVHPWDKERRKNWVITVLFLATALLLAYVVILIFDLHEQGASCVGLVIGSILVVILIKSDLPPFD